MKRNVESLIELSEGYRRFVYRCPAGKLTVGIGRNVEDRGISEEEARYLLDREAVGFQPSELRCRVYRGGDGLYRIGYGRDLERVGIRREEASHLLSNDISDARALLSTNEHFWNELDEVRQAVCIDLVFNLGWAGYKSFKKFRVALEVGDFETAGDELYDSKWRTQTGNRARRNIEMIRTGEWPEDFIG